MRFEDIPEKELKKLVTDGYLEIKKNKNGDDVYKLTEKVLKRIRGCE